MREKSTIEEVNRYILTIGFTNKKPWSKSGYTFEEAIELKTYFLECVPSATWGEMRPDSK